jgi:hypothetical protein
VNATFWQGCTFATTFCRTSNTRLKSATDSMMSFARPCPPA